MIEIGIEENKNIEEVKFGGTLYQIDFSDDKQKEYAASFENIGKRFEAVAKEYDTLSANEKATGDQLAKKSIELIEVQRDGSIEFLDLIFGQGEGQKLYEKCGRSTEYLRDKVEELATAINLKREEERKQRFRDLKSKFVHHNKKNR
ncbi:hypothetical protein OYT88_04575 [Sporolactobacillus sp. CQH2019]|uniref:hypothetical protein n=1 Tax=Sporolactobacillus sp. CQH2019 TaxID=3023512 RepID=UPI0023684AD6|nr:hypothetical protein [Sporolactobacillus sp. CQH2019]MDD9147824.1 hypothetical protein [Sporolactobacillus sp. CQH2019]